MVPIPIVITTIHEPNEAIKKFGALAGFRLYVAGDVKTPEGWSHKDAVYLSVADQDRIYKKLSVLIPRYHYARKNLAYLSAIGSGSEYIYETDDDNLPYPIFPNFLSGKRASLPGVKAESACNIYALFTKKPVWPRGLPLPSIRASLTVTAKKPVTPLIQQSLADLDPDVDAIYRLTNGATIRFAKNKAYALETSTYCPFNSQNTYWKKEVYPLLYLPSTVDSRVTDIWRGYIAQRILWELDSRLIFLSPGVYQERNVHNFQKDFEQETELYLRSGALIGALSGLKLKGSAARMMQDTYRELIRQGFFRKEEFTILTAWLSRLT